MAKKIELTTDNQKKSREYHDKIKELLFVGQQYKSRKKEAEVKLEQLKQKLSDLNTKIVMELDEKKLEKLAAERKELRFEIEDLNDLISVNVPELMMVKREELLKSNVKKESAVEFEAFNKIIIDELNREEAVYKARVDELEELRNKHLFNSATLLAQQVWDMIQRG